MCISGECRKICWNSFASSASMRLSVMARRVPKWRHCVHNTCSHIHCGGNTISETSRMSCLYWTSPFCTKNIEGFIGASFAEKSTSPLESIEWVMHLWHTFLIPAGFTSFKASKKGCCNTKEQISKLISIIRGSEMSLSNATSLEGTFCFCSASACCALRWMRTASGREMHFATKYLFNWDICCDCALEMICRRVIAVVSEPRSIAERMKPTNRTVTAKQRSVSVSLVSVISPTSIANDQFSDVMYR
mmetsp:Transcript_6496/g.19272  ORF Transcript_6496/g.19272 Transcript_6496/m.19272 type:complete len:247 (+) Transcript_6496:646-1386(+)